jgi:hypothetical protein
MNEALDRLARELRLEAPQHEPLRLHFGHACAARVAHLLESDEVTGCLAVLRWHLDGDASREALALAAVEAARLANGHAGSKSIDGCGHAAVSATYAVANALAGKALAAADYAAYAAVYGQGGYGAVAERESFVPEHAWQVRLLAALAAARTEAAT